MGQLHNPPSVYHILHRYILLVKYFIYVKVSKDPPVFCMRYFEGITFPILSRLVTPNSMIKSFPK